MSHPATIEVRTPEHIANWRPLVQWFLAIPHLIIGRAMEYLAAALAVVSWFVILFTGKLPEGIANLQIMIIRYSTRAHVYAGFLHDEYPPFEFETTAAEPGGTPVDLAIRPELEGRNRLTVGLRIFWIIPAMLFMFVIAIVGVLAWLAGFFAVLFTGRWPAALRSWVTGLLRVGVRFEAYAMLLTDEYPPFSTE